MDLPALLSDLLPRCSCSSPSSASSCTAIIASRGRRGVAHRARLPASGATIASGDHATREKSRRQRPKTLGARVTAVPRFRDEGPMARVLDFGDGTTPGVEIGGSLGEVVLRRIALVDAGDEAVRTW